MLVNPFMPLAPKTAWILCHYLSNISNLQKIFEEEMLPEVQPTIILQIFYKFMINSEGCVKSVIGTDSICHGHPLALMCQVNIILF